MMSRMKVAGHANGSPLLFVQQHTIEAGITKHVWELKDLLVS